jgi:hypothetical protein
MFVKIVPPFIFLTAAAWYAFIVKRLLHPKAGRGAVQDAQQAEVLFLRGLGL